MDEIIKKFLNGKFIFEVNNKSEMMLIGLFAKKFDKHLESFPGKFPKYFFVYKGYVLQIYENAIRSVRIRHYMSEKFYNTYATSEPVVYVETYGDLRYALQKTARGKLILLKVNKRRICDREVLRLDHHRDDMRDAIDSHKRGYFAQLIMDFKESRNIT